MRSLGAAERPQPRRLPAAGRSWEQARPDPRAAHPRALCMLHVLCQITMKQRLGGKYDGIWYTESIICDGCDDRTLFGVI